MTRWEPDAKSRLRAAALDLFASRGYEQVTAAEIAQAAGLTERTFYRHFADKREVLFGGSELLTDAIKRGAAMAPAGATPLEIVAAALEASAEFFPDERRPHSRKRQAVIDANPALQERELLKLAGTADVLAAALRERGVPEPLASLTAQTSRAASSITFAQWIREGEQRSYAEIARAVLAETTAMLGG